ncbi:MAG: prolipoprotein diacylglyceryl transferase [Candidatus Omnitrophica bacterium]|nr:prolipoprotein diacylglyceryl transferase [Candidatus Omnitrophota bacterium]
MFPEICRIGNFTVYSYGLMLVIAFIVSTTLAMREARKNGINPDTIFNFLFTGFISGVVGARIFYVAEHIGYYSENPLEIIMLQHGGLSWFGGLILGVSCAIFYLKLKKIPIFSAMDLVIPYLALAQSIGRIGCLLNGCCYGRPSGSYGIYFEVHKQALIPTQAYSTLLLLVIFIILRLMQRRPHKSGSIFFLYLLLYSAARFSIEFWRADNRIIFGGLTLFQLLSIAVFVIAAAGLVFIKKTPPHKIK